MIINQKYKKILYIFTVCILFLLFASYLRIHKKALTLKEAYLVSYKEAINWNENAKLYSVTSMDKIDNIETINGLNGKRFFWNFEYVVPMSNTHCIIEISEGKISNNIVINGIYVNSNIINSEDLVIDSSNALQSARKAINLKQGVDWAKGC